YPGGLPVVRHPLARRVHGAQADVRGHPQRAVERPQRVLPGERPAGAGAGHGAGGAVPDGRRAAAVRDARGSGRGRAAVAGRLRAARAGGPGGRGGVLQFGQGVGPAAGATGSGAMTPSTATAVRRLNWGCGGHTLPGWINSDQKDGDGIDLSCEIAHGLPLETGSIDYAVSIHALPEVPYDRLVPVLAEMRRVIKPGGILRLCLPDLIKGVRAYERG